VIGTAATPESAAPAATVAVALPAGPAPSLKSSPRPATGTWSYDVFDRRAERWQDPDMTACTASSAQSMLNTIAYSGLDPSLTWKPTVSYSAQESILSYERAHMTMRKSLAGSDPHGWPNALNYYGWGSIDAGVYRDSSFTSIDRAERAAVSALARFRKPVGVLSQDGRHSEFITGYRVTGEDPRSGSLNFRIVGVYLTDPWRAARYRDAYVTYTRWRWGFTWLRFSPYRQIDSPYRDPIDGRVGRSEWYGKWVIIEPTR
jgi:hypothetical protein